MTTLDKGQQRSQAWIPTWTMPHPIDWRMAAPRTDRSDYWLGRARQQAPPHSHLTKRMVDELVNKNQWTTHYGDRL